MEPCHFYTDTSSKTCNIHWENACAKDATKAFDKVSRQVLWCKLIDKNRTTNHSSYTVIEISDTYSDLFTTTAGVNQGGSISQKLFSMYLEDLVVEIDSHGERIYIEKTKISFLAYADDLMNYKHN